MTDTTEVDFDKEVDIDVDYNLDVDVNIDFDKDVDIDVDVNQDVDLDGNYANLTFDATAYGENTLAEADVFALVIEGELSEVGGTLTAAAGAPEDDCGCG
jgi:hypothetical protein